ncbi:MAG: hypothetical protein NT049_08245, partial [Planctomycetota bacterium]|nr:hypothetical protein [Planctomycetota bacterium]
SAENAVADLQTRLAELQGKAGLARTKVSNLQKATVDTRVPPPDGHVEDATHHATLKEGNFRTELQKQEAVRKAKEELMPIEVELRKVQDDLAKAKLSLGKLRATQETK